MSKRIHIPGSALNIIGGPFGMLGCLLRFARLMLVPKAVLAAKLLAAESQPSATISSEIGLDWCLTWRALLGPRTPLQSERHK